MKSKDNKLFFVFRDVIKTPDLAILESLKENNLKEEFGKYLDYSQFENLSLNDMFQFLMVREEPNVFKSLALLPTDEFDYDDLYNMCYTTLNTKYLRFPGLVMENNILKMAASTVVSKVYIWSEEKETEIMDQIALSYPVHLNKIEYVTGNFDDIVKKINADMWVVDNLDKVDSIINAGKANGTEIFVGFYGFNIKNPDPDSMVLELKKDYKALEKEKNFSVKAFVPYMPVIN